MKIGVTIQMSISNMVMKENSNNSGEKDDSCLFSVHQLGRPKAW